jgi:hypothetical protein
MHFQGVQECTVNFIDDSLTLLKENIDNATSLRQVLDICCTNSRQLVSEAKCSIFFNPNADVEVKAEVCSESNIITENHI